MSSNPYIAQHYGDSVEILSSGCDVEGGADATMGFRRFPNAPHMTHSVFRPKHSITSTESPAHSNGSWRMESTAALINAGTPDALATLRSRKGLVLDGFPSRPAPARGDSSAGSLPPLLPADRLPLTPSDRVRAGGEGGLLREWVRSSTDSCCSSKSEKPADGTVVATAEAIDCGTVPFCGGPTGMPLASSPLKDGARRVSSLPLPATAGTVMPAPLVVADAEDESSLGVSPLSFAMEGSGRATVSSSPIQASEAPNEPDVGVAIQRFHGALENAQRLLSEWPVPVMMRAVPQLSPPPPAANEKVRSEKATATKSPEETTCTGQSADGAHRIDQSESTSSVHLTSHASRTPHVSSVLGANGKACAAAAAPDTLSAPHNVVKTVNVPDETRFMVLCVASDPSATLERRLRRRDPVAAIRSAESYPLPPRRYTPEKERRSGRFNSGARVAEIPCHYVPEIPAVAGIPVKLACLPHSPKAAQNSPTKTPPTNLLGRSASSEQHAPHRDDDQAVLRELTDFLRGDNPHTFSLLRAAARPKKPSVVKQSSSARERRDRPSSAAGAPPAPTVLLGHPPPSARQRSSSRTAPSQLERTVTASSQLPKVYVDAGAPVNPSSQRGSIHSQQGEALPSYAQPTRSWLSKGSAASSDIFPVRHAASSSVKSA